MILAKAQDSDDYHQKFSNLGFLRSLIVSMTAADPDARVNAVQALEQWVKIRKWLFSLRRAWRVRPRDEHWAEAVALDCLYCGQLVSSSTRALVKGLRRLSRK